MKLRIIFAALGLVLAVVGVIAVNMYARGADERALRDQQPTDVLMLTQDVPAGTPVESLPESLEVRAVPLTAVATGAATSLTGLGGLVTSVDLKIGEQLLTSRLVTPESLEEPGRVDVPAGLQELTVQLSSDRVVGGTIAAGDTVGVIISDEVGRTHMTMQRILVTTVQGSEATSEIDTSGVPLLPAASVFVTVAVNGPDAERIVNGAEFGSLWLTKQTAETDPNGTRIVTPENLLQ